MNGNSDPFGYLPSKDFCLRLAVTDNDTLLLDDDPSAIKAHFSGLLAPAQITFSAYHFEGYG
jgi:hypothetical protein